jgi:hypothetical protein
LLNIEGLSISNSLDSESAKAWQGGRVNILNQVRNKSEKTQQVQKNRHTHFELKETFFIDIQ